MSAFHTKTIASVLEPVAQQVSQLVVLYEAGQQGQAMPDLVSPIGVVMECVNNLAKVAESTALQSNDSKFIRDFPSALLAVNSSGTALSEAVLELRTDPYSSQGRRKLIQGAKGILTGTCDLLLMYDESEVRKIVKNCEAVRSYFPVVMEVGTLDDLGFYIKNLTPGLTQVCKAVKNRAEELLYKPYADILHKETDHLKKLAPMLIGASKSLINAQGNEELTNAAHQNLDGTVDKMNISMKEIIRVLLLKDPDYCSKIIPDFHPLALAKDAVMADANRIREWLMTGALTDPEGLKTTGELVQAGQELAKGVSGPSGEAIAGVVKAIDDIHKDLLAMGEGGSDVDKASLKKSLLENVNKLDLLVKNTDVLASTPSGAVSRRIEDAKRWATSGEPLTDAIKENLTDVLSTSRAVAKATGGAEGAMIEKSCEKLEELMKSAGRLDLEIGNIKGKADNRARILAWLAQLDNQVKMADDSNILPSEVVKAGVTQVAEWLKDSPAVNEANAVQAFNKVVETAKSSATKLSAAERALVEGLVGEAEEAMQGYEACIHGPTPTQHAIKKQQGTLMNALHKLSNNLERCDMAGDNAADNVTTGVERVCDLLDSNECGANPVAEDSIRTAIDKVSAIGRAVAHHNPGSEGDEITALCDEAKKYLAQRTWIIKNPDKVNAQMKADNAASIKGTLKRLEKTITDVEKDRDGGTELSGAVADAQQWAVTGKGADAEGTVAVGKVISQSRYLARGLHTKDKREIYALCQELEDLIDEYNTAPEGRKRALRSQIADKMGQVKNAARNASASGEPLHEVSGLAECTELISDWLGRDGGRSEEGERAVEDCMDMAAALAKNIGGEVGAAIESQKSLVASLLLRLQKTLDDPNASPEQCAAAREELKVAICSLQDMCKEHLAAKVVDTFVDISGPVMELQAAALSPLGSVEKAEKFKVKASEFSLHAEQLCRVAEVATDVGCDEDPNRHDAIKISIEGVRDATPMVVLSAKTLSLNPKSESAKENFELVKQQWVAEASQLRSDVDKCVTPADFLVESERKCREEGQMAIVLMKTSPKEAVVKVSMVQKITNRVLEVTDAELENLGPGEYKNKLQADRVGLENAIKAAGDATNDHITGKTKDLNQFNKSVTEVHMNISRIREDMVGFYLPLPPLPEDLPPPIDDDTPPARPPGPAESDEEDDDFDVDAPAPDPVEAPIEHAAFKLRQETAKYYEDENDMITAARKIAQKFQQMAKYTKGRREILELGSTEDEAPDSPKKRACDTQAPSGDYFRGSGTSSEASGEASGEGAGHQRATRTMSASDKRLSASAQTLNNRWSSATEKSEFSSMTDMIKTCREVIALTKTIQKHANAISSNCPDKRLVMSLSNSMEPMGMLSQQLNIISSVKAAASGRYDESAEVEADEMLTINAQNLMKSVRDTVRASESCSVKIMSQAGNLQFKRKK